MREMCVLWLHAHLTEKLKSTFLGKFFSQTTGPLVPHPQYQISPKKCGFLKVHFYLFAAFPKEIRCFPAFSGK